MHLSKLAFALVALGSSLSALAAGCKGTVLVDGGNPTCPATFPDGQTCSDEGLTCTYEAAGCDLVYACDGQSWGTPTSACDTPCMGGSPDSACVQVGETCGFGEGCYYEEWNCQADHTWDVWYDDGGVDCCYGECECNPYYCPDVLPEEGAYCDPCWEGAYCEYRVFTACGDQAIALSCAPDYTWVTTLPATPCDCTAYPTVEECEADPACRFLMGGCEAPDLEAVGCFPKNDCAADMPCQAGATCTQVNANLCTIDPCIECAVVSLCL